MTGCTRGQCGGLFWVQNSGAQGWRSDQLLLIQSSMHRGRIVSHRHLETRVDAVTIALLVTGGGRWSFTSCMPFCSHCNEESWRILCLHGCIKLFPHHEAPWRNSQSAISSVLSCPWSQTLYDRTTHVQATGLELWGTWRSIDLANASAWLVHSDFASLEL